jgi:hypothetical protein
MDGGGGTGSRGRTPTASVEAVQALKVRPVRRTAEIVRALRMVMLHKQRGKLDHGEKMSSLCLRDENRTCKNAPVGLLSSGFEPTLRRR